jgi:hypothetical protein
MSVQRVLATSLILVSACSFDPATAPEVELPENALPPTAEPETPGDTVKEPAPLPPIRIVEPESVPPLGCLDDAGIDLFAAEADGAVALTWNYRSTADAGGGYRLFLKQDGDTQYLFGDFSCQATCEGVLRGLGNDVATTISVAAKNEAGQIVARSCELDVLPHPIRFSTPAAIGPVPASPQGHPAVATTHDGEVVLLAWEEGGRVLLARSLDRGLTWSDPAPLPGGDVRASQPRISVLDAMDAPPRPSSSRSWRTGRCAWSARASPVG